MRLGWLAVLMLALAGAVVLDTIQLKTQVLCDCAEDIEGGDETDDDALVEATLEAKPGAGMRTQSAQNDRKAAYVTAIDRPPCA